MKTLIPAAIRCSLMFTAVAGSLVCVQPAQAYTVTLQQMGSNVVATGSGAINLMGLHFLGTVETEIFIQAMVGAIFTGQLADTDFYRGFTGPTNFGSGVRFFANASSGDDVGIQNFPGAKFLLVPQGYVSNAALSDSMTFNNATFHSLGVTPGTYEWTWGTGLPNQNFTLIISQAGAGVPDGGSTVSLLGFALLGLAALRRKLSC